MWSEPNRFTPYHLPHSTEVKGLSTVYSGDDRYYNNIFVGSGAGEQPGKYSYGLEIYKNAKLPVFINDNLYLNGAKPYEKEKKLYESSSYNPNFKLVEKGNEVFLYFSPNKALTEYRCEPITSALLGKAKVPNAQFENPDGTPLNIDIDYYGNTRAANIIIPGPFKTISEGDLMLKVW
jgi:hypothetical protein